MVMAEEPVSLKLKPCLPVAAAKLILKPLSLIVTVPLLTVAAVAVQAEVNAN